MTAGTTMWPRQKLLSKFNDERCGLRMLSRQTPDGADLGGRKQRSHIVATISQSGSHRRMLGDGTPVLLKRHRSPAGRRHLISMAVSVGMVRCGGFCL
jgi:hypothetical protein